MKFLNLNSQKKKKSSEVNICQGLLFYLIGRYFLKIFYFIKFNRRAEADTNIPEKYIAGDLDKLLTALTSTRLHLSIMLVSVIDTLVGFFIVQSREIFCYIFAANNTFIDANLHT